MLRARLHSIVGTTKPRAWAVAAGMAALMGSAAAAYAFTGQTGSSSVSFTGAATNDKLATAVFTAPSTVTCMVTVDITTSTQSVNFNPAGIQVMWPLAQIAGSNQFGGQGAHVSPTVLGGYFRGSNTRQFTVNAGQTARFGCHVTGSSDFANAATFGNCTVTYQCLIPQ